MGKHASIQSSSTIRLAFRLFLLMLLVPAATVGCRGPWFQKADNFDALVVSEKNEARTPRAFASSRLRPSTDDNARATAPRPEGQSRAISDDAEEYALGEDLPSEPQDVFRRQMEAMKNKHLEDAGGLLAKRSSPNFTMSDDGESSSFESESASQTQGSKDKAEQALLSHEVKRDPSTKRLASEEHAKHPQSRDGERIQTGVVRTLHAKVDPPEAVTQEPKSPVVKASAVEGVDAGSEAKIKIENAKTDWRVLASETLAALQAHSDSTVVLSPDQKLSIEAKKRMLSLILDDLEGAMTPIENLQAYEQEFFQHEFQAIHAATDPKGNPVLNRRWTLALQSHRKAQMSLAAVSNLEIQNATFCTEVDSFGILSKFPQYHFRQNQELLLYCELDNFVSTPVKDAFETQLQGSYEIVDSNGRRVADQLLPPDEHICRNQRRDYFIAYRIYMPQDVKPGRYTLKLTIEDMKGHKFGQTNVDFQIIP